VLTEDVKFLDEPDRERILEAQRRVVAAFAATIAELRPELERAALAKPLTMLLFGMINWMFTWLRPHGALTHEAMAPVVADLFFGGVPAVRLPNS
jgi:TetR/AcrR family transcriptional regulator